MPEVGDQGVAVGVERRARGTCRAARPREHGAPVQPGGEVVPARRRAGGRPGRRVNAPTAIGAADDVVCEAAPDDLDLGELGHARGRSSTPVRRRVGRLADGGAGASGERRPGGLGGLLLGLLLAAAGALAVAPRRRRPTAAVKVFSWSGPSSLDAVLRDTERVAGGELLQAGLPVEAGAEAWPSCAISGSKQVVHEASAAAAGRRTGRRRR